MNQIKNENIRPVQIEEAAKIYEDHLLRHFPPEEVKPFANIRAMWKVDGYEVFGCYDGEKLLAYGFLSTCPDSEVVLLDYLAVLDEYRGTGIGSRFLRSLCKLYQQKKKAIIIETEDLDHACNQDEVEERIRRDRFYTGNGVVRTSLTSRVYDAFYRIWYLPVEEELSEECCQEEYDRIYRFMLSESGYRNQFEMY